MIPIKSNTLTNISELEITTQPSKTYKLNSEKERISNTIFSLKAIEQAIYKILNTERYKYAIYNWNYGVELNDLIGQPVNYVKTELERRIADALLVDDRINSIKDFSFKLLDKTTLMTSFSVETVYGELEINKEVSV